MKAVKDIVTNIVVIIRITGLVEGSVSTQSFHLTADATVFVEVT